jgi:hypothetical protein
VAYLHEWFFKDLQWCRKFDELFSCNFIYVEVQPSWQVAKGKMQSPVNTDDDTDFIFFLVFVEMMQYVCGKDRDFSSLPLTTVTKISC